MKISIVTLHRVFNFGSVLQAYATQEIFKKIGCEAEIIDYIPYDWQNKQLFFGIDKLSIKKLVYIFLRSFSIILKKITFGGFLKKYVNLTRKYLSIDQLQKNPPVADVYCTGSDQVWNSVYCGVDQAFFLDFGDKNIKRIAYAASFGKTKLSEDDKLKMTPYISRYKLLTLREDSACDIVEDLGFEGCQVIDPTLQIPKEHWLTLASKRLIKEKYLLLMLLYNEDNNATNIARKIADEKGLKLVKLSWDLLKDKRLDKLMTHRLPQEFLSLFYYADFVVTNSFHGTAFSINLNSQFVVVKRNEFNSRIESLLKLTGLTERLIEGDIDLNLVNKKIDFTNANNILKIEREKTERILKEALYD